MRIPRTFAVATTEVTVEQYLAYAADHEYDTFRSPELTCPVNQVSRDDARAYCLWLSKQVGLPDDEMCYELQPDGSVTLHPDWLDRTGYRLPTEEEWEYACRAGTETSRFYGQSEELLGAYAWYLGNTHGRARPVGLVKPNDFGLFDVYGNVYEWCEVTPDDGRERYVIRGGSHLASAIQLRSAYRFVGDREPEIADLGFRVACTLEPVR